MKNPTIAESEKYIDNGWVAVPENFGFFSLKDKAKWLKSLAVQVKNIPPHADESEKFIGIKINHDQAIEFGHEFCELVAQYLPGVTVAIDVLGKGLFTKEEFQNVTQLKNDLESVGSFVCFKEFDKFFSYEKACLANNMITNWADSIKKMRVDGRELSQLEKFFMAYNIVASFEYNESKDDRFESRSLISILTGDKIVCVGYAALLSELCRQLGIECITQMVKIDSSETLNHANCKVRIKDEIYDVDGIFYSDPCFGARKSGFNIAYALLPFGDIPKLFGKRLEISDTASSSAEPVQFGLDERFKDITPEQWQEYFAKYTKKHLPEFMKFIDEVTKGRPHTYFHLRPRKSDYDLIIDRYFCNVVYAENLEFSDVEGVGKDEYMRTIKDEIGRVILTYSRPGEIEKFKSEIAEYYLNFAPNANTYGFEGIQQACIHDYMRSYEPEVDKIKANSKPLSYQNLIKLLMNVLTASGVPKSEQDQKIKKLIVDSSRVAFMDWNEPASGENPISRFIAKLSALDPPSGAAPGGRE